MHLCSSSSEIISFYNHAPSLLQNNIEGEIINKIHERDNYIIRKSVNLSKQTHIIAANIDQAFLLVTVNNPVTTYTFIDRFLAAAAAYRIPVVLLFNKIDSYSNEEQQTLEKMQAIYTAIGYETHFISALEKEGIGDLKQAMNGKVSMFSGHSGVGKSTLANAISPELQLKTASVSTAHAQGQHTTTFAEMFDLDSGIRIIDTPGIRGFGVVDMSPTELADYFLEFLSLQELYSALIVHLIVRTIQGYLSLPAQ